MNGGASLYIVICNFPMGKAIIDFMDHTGIELDEKTIFHLDGILLENELKEKIIKLNELTGDALKYIDYYTSAVLTDDLDKARHWESASDDLSIYGVLEMDLDTWADIILNEEKARVTMQKAIESMVVLH